MNELFRNIVEVIFKPVKNRETRETRSSGVGRGGVELFRPWGVIGRGPQGALDRQGGAVLAMSRLIGYPTRYATFSWRYINMYKA